MSEPWDSMRNAPDKERAKTLALVLGCIVIGALYALGGIAIYLRRNVLVDTPIPEEHRVITRAPQAAPQDVGTIVIESPEPENPPAAAPAPTEYVPPTLYPTMTAFVPDVSEDATQPDTSSQPAQPTTSPTDPPPPTDSSSEPAAGQSAKATATLYPTATPRNDPTEPPPAPPTREGR